MSIKDLLSKIKGNFQNSTFLFKHKVKTIFRADFFTVIVIVLATFASFGLGRLSALEDKKSPIVIERNLSFSSSSNEIGSNKSFSNIDMIKNNSAKSFVASKSGTKYFLPWCGAVSKIKEENKIWFRSETEAKRAGYSPAANCKGL